MQDLKKQNRQNWLSLAFNIALPTLILMKGSSLFGAEAAFFVALAFPFSYGLFEYWKEKKTSVLAIVGFFAILVKGGLGFFKTKLIWFAVNEAAIPSILAVTCLFFIFFKFERLKQFILDYPLLNGKAIKENIGLTNSWDRFNRALKQSAFLVCFSFLISAVLNFYLALYYLQSDPGTEAFNQEMGKMTAMSFPIIFGSSSVFLILGIVLFFRRISAMTGLQMDQLFHADLQKK